MNQMNQGRTVREERIRQRRRHLCTRAPSAHRQPHDAARAAAPPGLASPPALPLPVSVLCYECATYTSSTDFLFYSRYNQGKDAGCSHLAVRARDEADKHVARRALRGCGRRGSRLRRCTRRRQREREEYSNERSLHFTKSFTKYSRATERDSTRAWGKGGGMGGIATLGAPMIGRRKKRATPSTPCLSTLPAVCTAACTRPPRPCANPERTPSIALHGAPRLSGPRGLSGARKGISAHALGRERISLLLSWLITLIEALNLANCLGFSTL
jgi:hypothetical protein